MEYSIFKSIDERYNCTIWHFMRGDIAFAKAVIYNNSMDSIILSELLVDPRHRSNGIGKELQNIREELGRSIGCKWSFLYVDKGSWMMRCYERRGYHFFSNKGTGEIWMRKRLLNFDKDVFDCVRRP